MVVVKAQKIPQKNISSEDIIACFCYNYPQYTYKEARLLPFTRLNQMIKVARQEQAKLLYNITRAIAAPHQKAGVKKLLDELNTIIQQ